MIRRPPRSTQGVSSAASDVYKRQLPDGAVLEVNHVDEGQPTEFWYAEVEYPTVEAARSWQPAAVGLADYLNDEVTDQPGQSMGAYWEQTRG